MAYSSTFVRSWGLKIASLAYSLNTKVYITRLEEYGGWRLTVDFGILLMRKMDDETCWSEHDGGFGGDGCEVGGRGKKIGGGWG